MEFLNATSRGNCYFRFLDKQFPPSPLPRRTIPVVHYTRISINRLSNQYARNESMNYLLRSSNSVLTILAKSRPTFTSATLSAFAPFNCSELRTDSHRTRFLFNSRACSRCLGERRKRRRKTRRNSENDGAAIRRSGLSFFPGQKRRAARVQQQANGLSIHGPD